MNDEMPDLGYTTSSYQHNPDALAAKAALSRISGVPVDEISNYLYILQNEEGGIIVGTNRRSDTLKMLGDAAYRVRAENPAETQGGGGGSQE